MKNEELFQTHPAPWHIGETHETRADVEDANSRRVVTISGRASSLIAQVIIGAANATLASEQDKQVAAAVEVVHNSAGVGAAEVGQGEHPTLPSSYAVGTRTGRFKSGDLCNGLK